LRPPPHGRLRRHGGGAATTATFGYQPGDPASAVEVIITAVQAENPPLRLLLVKAAYDITTARRGTLRHTFDTWRDSTLSADYPVG
jgi:hypothetical protein